MRASLVLLGLAAFVAMVSAGPVRGPGCWRTDSIPSFKFKHGVPVDFTKKDWVGAAYKQGRARAIFRSTPTNGLICTKPVAHAVKACYNSVDPGKLGPNQIGGQYGFVIKTTQECPLLTITKMCYIRMNTLRNNRFLDASLWKRSQVDCVDVDP